MRHITCDRCDRQITERELHVLKIELTNADNTVARFHKEKQADFCPTCAARVFRDFSEPLPKAAAA